MRTKHTFYITSALYYNILFSSQCAVKFYIIIHLLKSNYYKISYWQTPNYIATKKTSKKNIRGRNVIKNLVTFLFKIIYLRRIWKMCNILLCCFNKDVIHVFLSIQGFTNGYHRYNIWTIKFLSTSKTEWLWLSSSPWKASKYILNVLFKMTKIGLKNVNKLRFSLNFKF